MTALRARVIRGDQAVRGVPLFTPGPSPAQQRRVARQEIEAQLNSERILRETEERAATLLAQAKAEGVAAAAEATRQARVEADALLTARWVALRDAESRRLSDDGERIVPTAILLAERLLGAALELHPERIAHLAALVLAEARGARRATIEAHPIDAEALRAQLGTVGLDAQVLDVKADETLARGALRLHTDVGLVDAQLAPRLERLAQALREAFR